MSRVRDLHAALRSSHLGLADAVVPMTADQLMERSYCQDWTIAQLLSHLGSGAEIFGLFLERLDGASHAELVAVQLSGGSVQA